MCMLKEKSEMKDLKGQQDKMEAMVYKELQETLETEDQME